MNSKSPSNFYPQSQPYGYPAGGGPPYPYYHPQMHATPHLPNAPHIPVPHQPAYPPPRLNAYYPGPPPEFYPPHQHQHPPNQPHPQQHRSPARFHQSHATKNFQHPPPFYPQQQRQQPPPPPVVSPHQTPLSPLALSPAIHLTSYPAAPVFSISYSSPPAITEAVPVASQESPGPDVAPPGAPMPPAEPVTAPLAEKAGPSRTSLDETSRAADPEFAATDGPKIEVCASDKDAPADELSSTFANESAIPVCGWAIWSRRPTNPQFAPGIIISPRANPPQNIIEQALTLPTPPASPVLKPASLLVPEVSVQDDIVSQDPTSSAVPSSSVTDTTDIRTSPNSPVSSNTSLSLVGTPARDLKPVIPEAVNEDASNAIPPDAPAPTSADVADPVPPSVTDSASAPATTSQSFAAPAVPTVKKSWASLLRTAASSSVTSVSTRNALPTSAVMGFSVPAGAPPVPGPGLSEIIHSALATLLRGPVHSAAARGSASVARGSLLATRGPSYATVPASALSSPALAPAVSRIRPRGLINTGNMCFANVVLQILVVYCAPLHRVLTELGRLLASCEAATAAAASQEKDKGQSAGSSTERPAVCVGKAIGLGDDKTPLLDATIVFLREFEPLPPPSSKGKDRERDEEDEDESFVPSVVYDALKEKRKFDTMRGGQQEDAEEFLGFYLDALEEELLLLVNAVSPKKASDKKAASDVEEKEEPGPPEDDGWMEVGKRNRTVVTRTVKSMESPITAIFGGKFRSTLRAPHQKDSVVIEDWRALRLDIQREQVDTVQEALAAISHPQSVQITKSGGGAPVEASQQVLIESLPPVLVLHMKRFCYDTAVGGVVKVSKLIRFGPELDIPPDVMSPTTPRALPAHYRLFGALYHHGLSASGGHYTLDVLHPSRFTVGGKPQEGWIRIDDAFVSDVHAEDVFKMDADDSRCAYLLFYRRIR
ncbi:cysteine proteinase [Fistulina hepatica ATCC 64428]|uniref:ubiquitinyl hydrolase 1 n=1 Tax=Fistulina hepatica ATCC 64428 TaxID=1128425 RepID=A0A0D7AFA7_9AGAR|nr:cysteine proteinase [Fistulina hepatica ATCC 64428]